MSAPARGPDSAPLLRPNAFLASALRQVDLPEAGAAIDVGCGSGRDAVFLAQTLGDTWETIGVDNHKGALERAQRLADGCGVSAAFALANVRKQSLSDLTERPISIVHGCRFLDRPLLRALPEVVAPGGLVVWSTFLDGDGPPQAKPPEPSVSPSTKTNSASDFSVRLSLAVCTRMIASFVPPPWQHRTRGSAAAAPSEVAAHRV